MSCDSDFCNCGRCKATGSSVYLVKASATVQKTTVPTSSQVQPQPKLTLMELLKIRLKEPLIGRV